jgi:hypothetical protein
MNWVYALICLFHRMQVTLTDCLWQSWCNSAPWIRHLNSTF